MWEERVCWEESTERKMGMEFSNERNTGMKGEKIRAREKYGRVKNIRRVEKLRAREKIRRVKKVGA